MLRVILMRGELEETWIAVSLERYIAAQGSSPEDAIREFTAMLGSEIAYGLEFGDSRQPLAGIAEAPTKYWEMFESARPFEPQTTEIQISIEPNPEEMHVPAVDQYRLAA